MVISFSSVFIKKTFFFSKKIRKFSNFFGKTLQKLDQFLREYVASGGSSGLSTKRAILSTISQKMPYPSAPNLSRIAASCSSV